MGTWSPSLENLQLGTTASTSQIGISLGCERRLGVYKIPKELHHAVWYEFLAFYPDLASKVRRMASQRDFLAHPDSELTTNLVYATAIWGLYAYRQAAIPQNEQDTNALAQCLDHYFKRGSDFY